MDFHRVHFKQAQWENLLDFLTLEYDWQYDSKITGFIQRRFLQVDLTCILGLIHKLRIGYQLLTFCINNACLSPNV